MVAHSVVTQYWSTSRWQLGNKSEQQGSRPVSTSRQHAGFAFEQSLGALRSACWSLDCIIEVWLAGMSKEGILMGQSGTRTDGEVVAAGSWENGVLKQQPGTSPPSHIDGALVLEWAWSDVPYGELCFEDGTVAAIIHGLALCQYDDSAAIYRFSCNAKWEAEQDSVHRSIDEAKAQLPNQYRRVPASWIKP
jgi:hypothetical protein